MPRPERPQLADSLNEFARQHGIGLTTVRAEIKAGRLIARKLGRRTIIAAEDARAWLEELPKVARIDRETSRA
jgi:hypothetical protein